EVSADADDIKLTMEIQNDGATPVMLDAVRVIPLCSEFHAAAFDPVSRLPVATTDASGACRIIGLDRKLQHTISADMQTGVVEASMKFHSRAGSSSGTFQCTSPNALVVLQAAGGGDVETFRRGGSWV